MDNRAVPGFAFLYFHNHFFMPNALDAHLDNRAPQCALRSHCASPMSPLLLGSEGCCILYCSRLLGWCLLCPCRRVMFQSAGFLSFGKSCLMFLSYKLLTHIVASPDLKLAQHIGFVKSKRAGEVKTALHSQWQSLSSVPPWANQKGKAEGPRRKVF